MITLYKRNAQAKPIVWRGQVLDNTLQVSYGFVGGTLHKEIIPITLKNANELESRVKTKRKEGYKELSELKDSGLPISSEVEISAFTYNNPDALIAYLNTYLPKYSTTSEGFILPMLAKTLEDNKPFEKYGTMLGQWKINGLRCIIGAKESDDMFDPIVLTYHSREGEDWTNKMCWMDKIILPNITKNLLDIMIEEGACLDGELYLPGYSVNDINSFVKNVQLPQHYKLQYWCYDICCENMTATERNTFRLSNTYNTNDTIHYISTKEKHLNNDKQFVLLPTDEVSNISDAITSRDNFIDLGFEGLILRNPNAEYQFGKRNQAMFKFKKIDDGLFEIVNIKADKRNLPIFVLKNDINEEMFECTINLPQAMQTVYLNDKSNYLAHKAFVEYRERSGVKQVPFHAKIIKVI